MIFEILSEAARRGELILVEGGMCHYHLRKDGQVTIREILVLPGFRKTGIGSSILGRLKEIPGATSIFAKCPYGLSANDWYFRRGFTDQGVETTKAGKWLRLWRFQI